MRMLLKRDREHWAKKVHEIRAFIGGHPPAVRYHTQELDSLAYFIEESLTLDGRQEREVTFEFDEKEILAIRSSIEWL